MFHCYRQGFDGDGRVGFIKFFATDVGSLVRVEPLPRAGRIVAIGSAVQKLAGTLDLVLVTVNAPLDWPALISALAPNGRLHFVGVVTDPVPVSIWPLIPGQQSISGSPIGSPTAIATMLEFAARHNITPQTEHFPMSRINEAFDHLEAGNPVDAWRPGARPHCRPESLAGTTRGLMPV